MSSDFSTFCFRARRHFKWFTENVSGIGRSHLYYKINGLLFLLSFFAVRILPLPFSQYAVFLSMPDWVRLPADAYWMSYVMYVPAMLNAYWGYLVARMAWRAVSGYKPKPKPKKEE